MPQSGIYREQLATQSSTSLWGVWKDFPNGYLLKYKSDITGHTVTMISISKRAKDILHKQVGANSFVRITVKSGGCAGMTYDANIVSEKKLFN